MGQQHREPRTTHGGLARSFPFRGSTCGRASGSEPEGRGFEALTRIHAWGMAKLARRLPLKQQIAGSSPSR